MCAVNIMFKLLHVFQFLASLSIIVVVFFAEDVLELDSGECVICLEDLEQGDTIARLPCLCIYHKT